MAYTPFTRNYSDISNDLGYQFEFRCDVCGNGYKSDFTRSAIGTASNLLEGAGNLLGGLFGANLRNLGYALAQVRDKKASA